MTTRPRWTPDQARDMTGYANSVRIARSEFVKRMKELGQREGAREMAEVFSDPPDWARTWAVGSALSKVPGLGHSRLTNLAMLAELYIGTRIADLTQEKRHLVAKYLNEFGTTEHGERDE